MASYNAEIILGGVLSVRPFGSLFGIPDIIGRYPSGSRDRMAANPDDLSKLIQIA